MRFQTLLLAITSLAVSINAYWLEDITREIALAVTLCSCHLTSE